MSRRCSDHNNRIAQQYQQQKRKTRTFSTTTKVSLTTIGHPIF